MIKKVVISNLSTTLSNLAIGKILFYDNNEELIPSGNIVSSSATECETDNYIVRVTSSKTGTYPIDMIDTNNSNGYWISNNTTASIEIEFKKLVDNFTKLSIVPLPTSLTVNGITEPFNVDIYDYDDNIVSSSHDISPITERDKPQDVSSKIIRHYTLSSLETLNTTSNSSIKNVSMIRSVTVLQDEPRDTKIRYIFSIDGRQTWFVIRNDSMVTIDKANILTDGMSKDELSSISVYRFNANVTLDIMVGMSTSNIRQTPIVHKLTIEH